jgi:VCBS repeat-containing protein
MGKVGSGDARGRLLASLASASAGPDTLVGSKGADSLAGFDGNDALTGLAGSDTLAGGLGNDTLDGGSGDDRLQGGSGNDRYVVDSTQDEVSEAAGAGADTIIATIDRELGANQEALILSGGAALTGSGNGLDNLLVGSSAGNTLSGAAGNDRLEGREGDDSLSGGLGNDTLDGGSGRDTLDGGPGADLLAGGAGGDLYSVNGPGDLIQEAADGGADTVQATLDWTLGAHLEALVLLGTAGFEGIGNELGNRIVGTGRANRLVGGGGDDVLEGGFGNDLLEGGSAQDTLLGSRGKDVFVGGSGNDLMVGHGGTDRALYAGAASDYVITALDGGRWRIVHAATGDADTLTGVDRLDFDDGRVYLAANRAVQARLDRLRLTEDGPGATLNLLANDRDPDRDAFALVSVNGDTDGTLAGPFGTLAWAANGDATWTPDPASPALQAIRRDARHTEVFTYVVRDAEGLESQGELRIMITGANDAPTATASFLTVKSDATGTGRLAADDVDSDDGPDSLVYELVGGVPAGKGTLVLGPGGTFSFNPGDAFADLAPGASEDVTITWRATDRHGASTGNQTLTITVTADSATGVVAKPVISGILEYTGTPGDGITTDRTLTIHGTGNAGNRIEVSVDGQLVGSAIVAANGTWSVADATVRDDGDYAITAVAVGAGQTTSGPSDPFTAVVDTAAPGAPALGLAASSDTGERGDGVTALARVTLTGTAEAGATIEVLGTTVRALVAGDGRVTLPDVLLAPGENTLALRITDVAGNSRDAILDLRREESSPGGDPVRAWNQLTLDIIRADATTPAVATRAMAMESIAVLDTLAAIDGTPAFMVGLDAPEGVSAGVAVAAAAHRVLSYLYPSRTAPLNERLASDLATMPAGAARDASVEFGRAVADAVIAIRDRDGWNAFATFDGGTEPGEWRPTGPSFEVAQAPHWAALTPFTLQSGDQFRADGPPDFDSAEYAAALNEVKSLGSATSATRTAEQTQIARFWADGAGSYTPPGHWNQIAAEIAAQQGYELGAAARILAMLNITLADSSIAAWDTKYAEGFWRPVTAIRLADTDGNAATAADAAWQPLLLTPPHPEYVSGHSTYSAAAATILTEIFGEMSFSTTSIGLPGVTRSFDSFLDAAQEAGRSRIYGGIHFEFSNQDGQGLGTDIATWVLGSFATDRDVRAPVVLVDQAPGAVAATIPDLTGFALDNLAGLSSLTVRLGDGAAQSVAVDSRGRFALDTDGVFGALADGTHTLTFTARDAAGNATSQAFSFVLDRAAPTLNVSSLADGDELEAGARLTGRVDGTGSGITSFSYVLGSGPAVPITFDKATGAFDVALDLSKLAPGAVTLTLSARDAAGNLLTQQLSLDMPSAVPFAIASVLPGGGCGGYRRHLPSAAALHARGGPRDAHAGQLLRRGRGGGEAACEHRRRGRRPLRLALLRAAAAGRHAHHLAGGWRGGADGGRRRAARRRPRRHAGRRPCHRLHHGEPRSGPRHQHRGLRGRPRRRPQADDL